MPTPRSSGGVVLYGLLIRAPASDMVPEVGCSKPATMRSNVVLPLPLSPSSASTAPRPSSSDTMRNAGRGLAGKYLDTSCRRRWGPDSAPGDSPCAAGGVRARCLAAWRLPFGSDLEVRIDAANREPYSGGRARFQVGGCQALQNEHRDHP